MENLLVIPSHSPPGFFRPFGFSSRLNHNADQSGAPPRCTPPKTAQRWIPCPYLFLGASRLFVGSPARVLLCFNRWSDSLQKPQLAPLVLPSLRRCIPEYAPTPVLWLVCFTLRSRGGQWVCPVPAYHFEAAISQRGPYASMSTAPQVCTQMELAVEHGYYV